METLPDPRATGNQLVLAKTDEEIYRALCVCYGEAELAAMVVHDARLSAFMGDGPDRWRRAEGFLRERGLHEHREPDLQWRPFRPIDRRYANDVVHTVIGISPTTGWAALLAGPPGATTSRLYMRNAIDIDRNWSAHRTAKRVPPVHSVDVHDVYATFAAGNTVYVANMSDAAMPLVLVDVGERVLHAASNGTYLLVIYGDGQLGVWRLNTESRQRIEIVLPRTQAAPPAVAGTNPVTGEPLDVAAPTVEMETCRAARVSFNQLGGNVFAVSLHNGLLLVCTIGDDGGVTFQRCLEMGPAPALNEPQRLRHPPQEPASSVCLRMLPTGEGQPVVAQCGFHVTYRTLEEPNWSAAVVPRFPMLFTPDVGPVLCVGVCGTTIVTHTSANNRITIGSLVPGPHDPHTSTMRFAIDGSTAPHGLIPTAPYPSLCVLPTVILCLMPDGVLVHSEPNGATRAMETDIPAV